MTKEEETEKKKRRKEKIMQVIENTYDTIRIDEDNFESKITYINAGAIGLIITIIGNINIPICTCYFWIGIVSCGLSLLINMACYLLAKYWHRRNIKKLYKRLYYMVYHNPNYFIDRTNRRIEIWNYICLFLMVLGIVSLVLFTFKNI